VSPPVPPAVPPDEHERRLRHAIRLSVLSVCWAVVSASIAITVGLLEGSLGVLGVGLNVTGDMVGSLVLIWRFRLELRDPTVDARAERTATVVVAGALLLVGTILTFDAIVALARRTQPDQSAVALWIAIANALVLPPLGTAKRRTGRALGSSALMGDGSLSLVGGALAVIAIVGLVLDSALGWWWADRVAGLVVAVVAFSEAVRILREPAPD
jgi:divalent metal cation (Fe/Co/Zn/Cd) transporter